MPHCYDSICTVIVTVCPIQGWNIMGLIINIVQAYSNDHEVHITSPNKSHQALGGICELLRYYFWPKLTRSTCRCSLHLHFLLIFNYDFPIFSLHLLL